MGMTCPWFCPGYPSNPENLQILQALEFMNYVFLTQQVIPIPMRLLRCVLGPVYGAGGNRAPWLNPRKGGSSC